MITCKNCDTSFEGKFCPSCSQRADTHRFSLMHFGHEFLHALTHTDKGIIFLMKELLTKPGKVALEFNAGKRKKYFNPFSFLLIMTAVQVFVAQKSNITTGFIDQTEILIRKMSAQSPDVNLDNSFKALEEGKQTSVKVMEYNKLMTFLLIPFMSLLSWLLFKKSGHNYAENLVMNMLIIGELAIFFIAICVIPYLIFPPTVVVAYYVFMLVAWIYSLVAYKQFFQQRKRSTIVKGLLVQVVYIVAATQLASLAVKYL